MTDMTQGTSQDQGTLNSSTAPQVTESAKAPEVKQERTFNQSEVTDIVKRERQEAIDRYRRLENEQPDYVARKYGDVQKTSQHIDENYYRQIAAEEAQKLHEKAIHNARSQFEQDKAKETVSKFTQKMNAGREKYQDFDQVTGEIDYSAFSGIVQLAANHVENAEDVLYSLGQDPTKMELLEGLASRSPQLAIKEVKRLAKSIAENESARKIKVPNEPLSQLRPSTSSTGNDGAWSVAAARKKYRG